MKRCLTRRFFTRFGRLGILAEKALAEAVYPALQLGAFFIGVERLTMPGALQRSLHMYGAAVLMFGIVRLAILFVRFWMIEDWPRRHTESQGAESQFKTFMPVVQIGLWMLGLLV